MMLLYTYISDKRHYKIVMYICSIASQKSNHLPHIAQHDVLTTTLMTGVVDKGEKWYLKKVVIIESSTVDALVFILFSY